MRHQPLKSEELQQSLQTIAASSPVDDTLQETARSIDGYRLIRKIGVGGMGEVWAAEQHEPVHRQVAVKLIRPGLVSPEVMSRFQAERQALALMNHPNIAKILDAGTEPTGQQYFVMELVDGQPLTCFCDENRLNIDERVRLFVQVCLGVQHAHQKGIIHRDLKPSNILVGREDDIARPKVIDFGLAKAIHSDQPLTDASLHTGFGQILGTVRYMSPEQARLSNVDIDTRTDIYSLGVVLYELLTGENPFDESMLQDRSPFSVLELLHHSEPLRPSRKISSQSDMQLSQTNTRRKTNGRELKRRLRDDLDWIVMKAIEKDRDRRYGSATELAADLERYLRQEPIIARPPSLAYQFRKYSRKYRGALTAATAIAAVLLASTIISVYWAQHAIEQRRQTERSYRLLAGIFQDLDVHQPAPRQTNVADRMGERLKQIAATVDKRTFPDDRVRAEMQGHVGRALLALGEPATAVVLLTTAVGTSQALGLAESPDTIDLQLDLSRALMGSGKLADAYLLATQVVSAAKMRLSADDAVLLRYKAQQTVVQAALGGEAALEAAHQGWQEMLHQFGDSDPDVLTARSTYAYTLLSAGRFDEAADHYTDIIAKREQTLSSGHIDILESISSLSSVFLYQNKTQAAVELAARAYQSVVSEQAGNHEISISIKANYAEGLARLDQGERALEILRETYRTNIQPVGLNSEAGYTALNNLANLEREFGNLETATSYLEQVRSAIESIHSREHPRYLSALNNLIRVYELARNLHLALERLDENLALRRAQETPDETGIYAAIRKQGILHRDLGNPADALSYFVRVAREAPLTEQFKEAAVELFELYAQTATPADIKRQLPGLYKAIERRSLGDAAIVAAQHARIKKILDQRKP